MRCDTSLLDQDGRRGLTKQKVQSMKTMKKLQVATAVAGLFAVGATQAATLNSSGSIVAAETVFESALGAATRVRAPAFTYKYEGGVNASSSQQAFAIAVTLGGANAQWAVAGAANPAGAVNDVLVPGFPNTDAGRNILAHTILAFATVQGVTGRVAVLPRTAEATIVPGTFGIVLDEVQQGNKIGVVDNNPLTYTFKFRVVNNTLGGVNLDKLELQFNTQKVGTAAMAGSAPDVATDAAAPNGAESLSRWLTIWNINSLSATTQGRDAATCNLLPAGQLTLSVGSGINEPPVPSNEETLNNNQGSRVTINNYLNIRRALALTVGKSGDRLIQTTNSFPTNLGANPTNGIGGTGGGRYTFKPTRAAAYTPNFGQSIVTNTATSVGGNPTPAVVGTPGLTLNALSSGDERAANIGTITFGNHPSFSGSALDRQLDVDNYTFIAEALGGATGSRDDADNNASGAGRSGDFTNSVSVGTGAGAPANVFGGVDLVQTGASNALIIEFDSKADFAGFARGNAAGQLSLVPGAVTCPDPTAAALPGTMLGTLVQTAPGSGRYNWTFTRTELAAAAAVNPAGANSLRGTWTACYTVNGTTSIPATFFRNVLVTLPKDDSTEQANTSCPGNWANIYGGVKVDVRNFQSTIAGEWLGVTRIINNSERDVATVEGQFIHQNTGAYGRWAVLAGPGGLVAALQPRAVAYLFNSDIETHLAGALGNDSTASGANNARPAANTNPRLRVSADVSTIRVQSYVYNLRTTALAEVSASQGADFVNIDSSNRDHIDQDAQADIAK